MKVKIAIAVLAVCLSACGTAKEDFGTQPAGQDRVVELPPEKRAQIIKNELFENVWNNSSSGVQKTLSSDAKLIHEQNDEGDTPFALALKNGYKNIALQMLPSVPVEDYYTKKNNKGEGYIFLAARSGFFEIITQMADTYYKTVWLDYEFKTIDMRDNEGRNALMVAADRRTAEALERQYWRGTAEVPFWSFTRAVDNRERTFIHWAAAEGRDDVILWAADRLCRDNYSDDWSLVEAPLAALEWVTRSKPFRYMQIHWWGDHFLTPSLVFNHADSDYMTALHVAVSERRWSSVRALASCKWLDYDLQDAHEDTALHAFLKALNPLRPADKETKETFAFLFSRNTPTRLYTQDERADRQDEEGNSPLHYAARLSDPFFYQELAKVGNVNAENSKGQTAESIFKTRQNTVGGHGQ